MFTRRLVIPGPAVIAALLVAVPAALSPLRNADLFFHLAGAQWVLAHSAFPAVDPFSFTAPHGWSPHEWGWGVLAELSTRAFGAAGPALLTAACLAAFILLLWRALRIEAAGGAALLVVFAAAVASSAFTWIQERPFHLSHALFAVSLLLVQAWRRNGSRTVWLFVPLCALWANLHASWMLAPALLGSTLVGRFIDGKLPRREALTGAVVSVLCLGAATLTPLGFDGLIYPLWHAALTSTRHLDEWRPLWALSTGGSAFAFVALLAAALVLVARTKSARRFSTLLPALGLAAATLHASRHQAYAAMALAVFVASALPARVEAPGLIARWSRCNGAALVALVLAVIGARAVLSPVTVRDGLEPGLYPTACLDTLRALPPGKVMNHFLLGGAVAYFAGPEHQVFIDGRNDPFPEEIHAAYWKVLAQEPGWEAVVGQADYVLWFEDDELGRVPAALVASGRWAIASRDNGAVLLTRRDGAVTLASRRETP